MKKPLKNLLAWLDEYLKQSFCLHKTETRRVQFRHSVTPEEKHKAWRANKKCRKDRIYHVSFRICKKCDHLKSKVRVQE